jgi:hypothetical protein
MQALGQLLSIIEAIDIISNKTNKSFWKIYRKRDAENKKLPPE